MQLFFSVGDPSGDLHAANLVRQLRKRANVDCAGFGGPRMQQAGCQVLYPLTDLALMWFLEAVLNAHRFADLLARADRYLRRHRPDGVVLVDFPGFNWWMARRAHAQGIPVFYYVPPQLWAWAPWRVRKMRRFVDHVLCSLPFEKSWYEQRGVQSATFVGHPYFDEIAGASIDRAFVGHWGGDRETRRRRPRRAGPDSGQRNAHVPSRSERRSPLVALLPGSRKREVTDNFPLMVETARRLHRRLPAARFLVACFKDEHRSLCSAMLAGNQLPVDLFVGKTREIIHAADVCVAVSGSVGLELLYETTPTVVVYKVSTPMLYASRVILRTRYISLVNLLAGGELFPEYLIDHDASEEISETLYDWLTDRERYQDIQHRLADLKRRAAIPGASSRAADYIFAALTRSGRVPAPHFGPAATKARRRSAAADPAG